MKLTHELSVLYRTDTNEKDSTYDTGMLRHELSCFDIDIIKYEDEGTKRLAFEIKDQEYAGYLYFEYEVDDFKASRMAKAISDVLNKDYFVLRHLLVNQPKPKGV